MASSSISTTLHPAREAHSSQLLTSSISSLSSQSTRQTSSQISKIYRQSSTLFLTRRLPESLSTILPVITPPNGEDDTVTDASGEVAPVAKASRTTRIKVWSLYLTILNAVQELDVEDGKQAFGGSEYRGLVNKVRDGEVWEEVVRNGYGGVEGDVDADVVINLATLLLAHARTQKVNQQRLEAYLAASTNPNIDLAARLQLESRSGARTPNTTAGADTPRDLNARVKILELYTLHVLLRNNEWDYARDFITMSEVLDEERREAFLQALQSLQDEQKEVERREREERLYQEEILRREIEEQRRQREAEERERRREEERRKEEKGGSEIDYGVEEHPPPSRSGTNSSAKARSATGSSSGARKKASNGATARHSKAPAKKAVPPTSMIARAGMVVSNVRKLVEQMAGSVKGNPIFLLRFLVFLLGFLALVTRRDVRDRISRMWTKVRQTAGMGVKVSYI